MNGQCNQLDLYLAGDLPVNQASLFEIHLPQCDACREAIDQQQWIDTLLQSPLRLQLEHAPTHLFELARTSPRRRIVPLAACGLAAAAMLVVAVGWWELNRQAVGGAAQHANRADIAVNVHVRPAAVRTATFVGGPDVIAVPIESHHPDVTIVRIYPTFRPREDSQTVAVEPNSAVNWNYDFSNGG